MGPLAGLKIIELFCIGPGPFAGMLLSDMGADVLLVDRVDEQDYGYPDYPYRYLYRNRRSIRFDWKDPADVEHVLRLVEHKATKFETFQKLRSVLSGQGRVGSVVAIPSRGWRR